MHKSRHIELETLEKELDSNYRDLAFLLAFISYTYEGFGVGFSNIAAAAAYGLRIPLVPVYLVGLFVGVSYLLVELRSTMIDLDLQRQRLLDLERKMITSNYCSYLSYTIPEFKENDQLIDITTLLQTHKVEDVAQCLGHYYQQVQEKAKHSELSSAKKSALLKELKLKYSSEVSQFNNPSLVQILNTACNTTFYTPTLETPPTRGKRFLNNLRKYYKSSLTGAATAGGVTIFILTTALTTATVTALFPWSLLGISLITIFGAFVGYKIDKYLDRKRKHKNNLKNTANSYLTLKNCHRVAELFRSTIMTLNELESSDDIKHETDVLVEAKSDADPHSASEPLKLSNEDYTEVAKLRSQSHTIRRWSDLILPTLLLARGGFASISSLFAGIGFAGLVLPLMPVFIIGGILLSIHIVFKIWNNVVKHQSEIQAMNNLNFAISPEKIHYWKTKFPDYDDLEHDLKTKPLNDLLTDLAREYEHFKHQLTIYEESTERSPEKSEKLKRIHDELLSLFRSQADSLNNTELALSLATTALYVPPITMTDGKVITFWNKTYQFISPAINFTAQNFKDVVQGIAFGFGLSITIFLILGITSIVAIEAALILIGTSLAGVAMKVAIRHLIKAYRNEHLATIESASKDIADKESLWDCRAELKDAHARAKTIIDQENKSQSTETIEFIKDPAWSPGFTLPKTLQPLQWIHSDATKAVVDKAEESVDPFPRNYVC